ncbi:hypothetical protein PHMEG_00038142 [Phytophthora megakarya]|uniref:Uncharacterized protein n=1 Tax=Phytophthora megakarya TaxID=4795 RepID=A0A225UII4_9STRA|nr:hypothetical protein PHMEG_00038142 [Phytophthora megakarya]
MVTTDDPRSTLIAGGQYLGRVVAGLPVNKSVFAVLPPQFGIARPDRVRMYGANDSFADE